MEIYSTCYSVEYELDMIKSVDSYVENPQTRNNEVTQTSHTARYISKERLSEYIRTNMLNKHKMLEQINTSKLLSDWIMI